MRNEELSNISLLKNKVRCNTCVFLGSGSSIKKITNQQWDIIKADYDIWAVNNWVYHPYVVPNFYHIEVKHYNYNLIQQRLYEKRKKYKKVDFIFPMKKSIKTKNGKRPLHEVTFQGAKKFCYEMKVRDARRTHSKFNADYQPSFRTLTKSYDMSISTVLELIYHCKYKAVILLGVDLNNSFYFWSDGEKEYGEVHHLTNKAHENKDPNLPHATHRIKDFIFDMNERWMKPEKREIFVGHKDTILYPHLRLKGIL